MLEPPQPPPSSRRVADADSLRDEADAHADDARRALERRGREEAEALRDILARQHDAIVKEMDRRAQLTLELTQGERAQREHFGQDKKHLDERLVSVQTELETEPDQIESPYEVVLHRLEPVGLWFCGRGRGAEQLQGPHSI